MAILSTRESTSLDENIRCGLEWLKNAKSTELVNLKCETYAQPISLSFSSFNFPYLITSRVKVQLNCLTC